MKVNAPDKLYISNSELNDAEHCVIWFNSQQNEKDIEYIRKDVFIKKALKFIKTNVDRIVNNQHGVRMGYMDGEFRKYMEGE